MIGDSEISVPVHLMIVLGLALMLGGLVALSRSIRRGSVGALARLDSPPPATVAWTHRFKPSGQPAEYKLFDQV